MNRKQKRVLCRIILSAVLLILANAIPAPAYVKIPIYLISYLVIGYDILRKAFRGIRNRRIFDEQFLMAVATLGAIALAVINRSTDFNEAVAVMLFYQIGELFQGYAVGKSRRNISELMDIRPDYANLESGGELEQVDPDEVPVGSIIVVQPGEKVPIDGIVVSGSSTLNTSSLTGESVPRDVSEGAEIFSGCINLSGVLRIRTTREFGESTVSKILELMEESSSRKSKSENFISRFAMVYTPAVCGCALALAVLPSIVRLLLGMPAFWGTWLYRALTFLVISCPCALVVSIPLTFFAGLGGAGKEGILIKGSNYMETLSQIKTVVFDKTGTMTRGVFEVRDIHHSSLDREKLLEYAAHAECASSHPISKSLQQAHGSAPDRNRVSEIREISGAGVVATVDRTEVAVGNGKLMDQMGIPYKPCRSSGTIVHMALDGAYAGHVVISDVIKPEARAAVDALRQAGVEKTVMLTGDMKSAAEEIAQAAGVDTYYSDLLPADKVRIVEELMASGGKVAFAGDGINDAPVLSRADVGIAMGALGSDAAIEAADVVLMDDDPMKIAKAIRISRKCLRIVYENIIFSLGVKFLCLILGAFGLANMWAAIFADVGVMVLAVLNAIRALRVHRL